MKTLTGFRDDTALRDRCRLACRGFAAIAWAILVVLSASALRLGAEDPQSPLNQGSAQKPENRAPARYVNRMFPKWFRVSGEYRVRPEGRTAFKFTPDVDDAYVLSRFRLNLEAKPTPRFRVFAQAQDARAGGIDPTRVNSTLKDAFDLRQLYVEFKSSEDGKASVQGGRQELIYGIERLVGAANWTNTARVFDALRLRVGQAAAHLDLFTSSVVVNQPTSFDRFPNGLHFHGAYGVLSKAIPRASLEPYVFWKTARQVKSKEGKLGNLDLYTVGLRWAGQLPLGFDYAMEGAHQNGHFANDHIAAWGGYWIVGYSPSVRLKPRFSAEYTYATGDSGRQNQTGTFDQLYPTNHGVFGLTDQLSWRNIKHVRAGVELKPLGKLRLNADYHSEWLANRLDALYGGTGSVAVKVPKAGALHTHIGQEADFYFKCAVRPELTVGSGFGHLFPGRFLLENSPGSGTSYPYIFLEYKF